MSMSGLTNLPYQLLLDEVVNNLDVDAILNLRQVSRSFQQLADDDLVWRRKIAEDFTFPIQSTARTSGWKNLYKGLYNPELFTWGDYGDYRIGQQLTIDTLPSRVWNIISRCRGVPFPLSIKWQDAPKCVNRKDEGSENGEEDEDDGGASRIPLMPSTEDFGAPIQIHAGGWSFYALTGKGHILAWGSCAGGFENVAQNVMNFVRPTLLDLHGRRAKSLTVGREHAVAQLDDGSLVEWTNNWDRPICLDVFSLLLDTSPSSPSQPAFTIVQVEAGWNFTAVLTQPKQSRGTQGSEPNSKTSIFLWRTKWTLLWRERYLRPLLKQTAGNVNGLSTANGDGWQFPSLKMDVITLPPLPSPIVKIAAGEDFIIALTEEHSVYYISIPATPRDIDDPMGMMLQADAAPDIGEQGRAEVGRLINRAIASVSKKYRSGEIAWRLLPQFCKDLRASGRQADDSNIWSQDDLSHLINDDTKITHISAQFQNFAVYAPNAGSESPESEKGKGIVILGNRNDVGKAIVIPELQGIQVIKVAHGDWHHGALTLDGRVVTWGARSNGALGTWDSIPVADNAPSTLHIARAADHQSTMPIGRNSIHMRQGLRQGRLPTPISAEAVQQEQDLNREVESTMVKAEKERYKLRNQPTEIKNPLPVRFGFPVLREERNGRLMMEDDAMETKYTFDIAFAGWHSGALAIDRSLMTQEEQYTSLTSKTQAI
ncbi:hypothetical protein CBS101457_002038 [Exobasidium rhododendri]|nr:hypothetical protein CBS101457_002038 [Exobasidium rhododendri]